MFTLPCHPASLCWLLLQSTAAADEGAHYFYSLNERLPTQRTSVLKAKWPQHTGGGLSAESSSFWSHSTWSARHLLQCSKRALPTWADCANIGHPLQTPLILCFSWQMWGQICADSRVILRRGSGLTLNSFAHWTALSLTCKAASHI